VVRIVQESVFGRRGFSAPAGGAAWFEILGSGSVVPIVFSSIDLQFCGLVALLEVYRKNRSISTERGSDKVKFCGRNRTRTYDLCDVNAALSPAELSAHGKDYTTTTGNEQVGARHRVRQVVRYVVKHGV
jgi:hypothetical protein